MAFALHGLYCSTLDWVQPHQVAALTMQPLRICAGTSYVLAFS